MLSLTHSLTHTLQVVRFDSSTKEYLGFHRFSVGDTVRVSKMNSRLGPLSPSALEGVVLDRRPKYIDISLRGMDSMQIDVSADYRLDCFVNRVSYDRMLESLQLLLQSSVSSSSSSSSSSVSELKISQAIKDLLLYSYPNSMLRLARSPGGLKLALPALHFNHLRISNDDDAVDVDGDGALDRVGVSAINEVGGVIGDGKNRLINTMSRSDAGVQHEVTTSTTTTSAVAAVVDEDDSILAIDRISIIEPSPATAPSSINNPTIESRAMTTVASALSSLLQQSNNINIDNIDITIPIIPPRTIKIKTILLAERNNNKTPQADLFYQPIFKTNVRLRAVAQLPDISRANSLDVTESAPSNGDTRNYPSGAVSYSSICIRNLVVFVTSILHNDDC